MALSNRDSASFIREAFSSANFSSASLKRSVSCSSASCSPLRICFAVSSACSFSYFARSLAASGLTSSLALAMAFLASAISRFATLMAPSRVGSPDNALELLDPRRPDCFFFDGRFRRSRSRSWPRRRLSPPPRSRLWAEERLWRRRRLPLRCLLRRGLLRPREGLRELSPLRLRLLPPLRAAGAPPSLARNSSRNLTSWRLGSKKPLPCLLQ
mmetsp:Transcript_56237/g.161403  ORF Transcript_56237/g.161403 Transcript_56237/m.161403 type:complete len:213 (+) Transcript_56237:426-1064(+)